MTGNTSGSIFPPLVSLVFGGVNFTGASLANKSFNFKPRAPTICSDVHPAKHFIITFPPVPGQMDSDGVFGLSSWDGQAVMNPKEVFRFFSNREIKSSYFIARLWLNRRLRLEGDGLWGLTAFLPFLAASSACRPAPT